MVVTDDVIDSQRGCGFFPKRRTMKKLNKVAMLIASAALATAAGAQTIDNWKNGSNELVWKNANNELCHESIILKIDDKKAFSLVKNVTE